MPISAYQKISGSTLTKIISRSPTLDTVIMVERTIEKYSGEFTIRELWQKLPKKVMWGTYRTIINYLESINKIGITKKGIVVYIWNPELARRYIKKIGLKYEKR